jgi:hypothetical protein
MEDTATRRGFPIGAMQAFSYTLGVYVVTIDPQQFQSVLNQVVPGSEF